MSIFGKKPDQQPQSSSAPESPPAPAPAPSPQPAAPAPAPAPAPARTPSPAPAARQPNSFLNAGCELVGELSGEGSFECGGRFEGTIDITGDLVVRHGGTAKAELKARRINIEGRLAGNATGSEKVEVGASGHVEGDVRAPAVQFAEGAFFEGNVEMRRAKAQQGNGADEGGSSGDGADPKGGDKAAS